MATSRAECSAISGNEEAQCPRHCRVLVHSDTSGFACAARCELRARRDSETEITVSRHDGIGSGIGAVGAQAPPWRLGSGLVPRQASRSPVSAVHFACRNHDIHRVLCDGNWRRTRIVKHALSCIHASPGAEPESKQMARYSACRTRDVQVNEVSTWTHFYLSR